MTNLTNLSPVEIDTFLSENWEAQAKARQNTVWAEETVRRIAGQSRDYRFNRWNGSWEDAWEGAQAIAATNKTYVGHDAQKAITRWEDERNVYIDLVKAAGPYEEEFNSRPWNRYFIVRNSNGHVHRNRSCSTCFPTTQYGWIVKLADADEAALVAEYGELACTICFPDAPTYKGFGDGTSAIAQFSAAEKQAKADEKAAKAAAKAAKNLLHPQRVYNYNAQRETGRGGDYIETIYAAKQWIKRHVEWTHGDAEAVGDGLRRLTVALKERDVDIDALITKWTKGANK